MWQAFKNLWVLYFGLSVLWLGTGMSYTLLVIRANAEGFTPTELGFMQTSYQVGWVIAALIASSLIMRVGHLRIFAAVSSVCSALILIHLLYINPIAWTIERLLMGVATAVLMVVCESWLNDAADNSNRGKVLALYTILSWGLPAVGVYVLRFNDTGTPFFFILASIFISIAVIPMLLSASRTPTFIETERLGLKKLYKMSPTGIVGGFLSGIIHGILMAVAAIYATVSGFNVTETSNLITLSIMGGIVTQWPIAMISDRFDRRTVIAMLALACGGIALYFGSQDSLSVNQSYVAIALISATALSLYSLCISHANDYLSAEQIVPASSTLILIYGIGYALSPMFVSPLLSVNRNYFFLSIALFGFILGGYVLYRMKRREGVSDQGDTLTVLTTSPYASVVSAAEEWGDEEELQHDAPQ